MIQVISGKIYDTDTAEEICQHSHGNSGDFEAYRSVLYRSPRGRFFLDGRGGPMSRWARPAEGGGTEGGYGIRLLDRDEARAICEQEAIEVERMRALFAVEEGRPNPRPIVPDRPGRGWTVPRKRGGRRQNGIRDLRGGVCSVR